MVSCTSDGKKEAGNDKARKGARSSGKTAEVIVSTNSEKRWEGVLGDTVRNFFAQEYQVLPQPEPIFEPVHVPIDKLESNKMFRAHHNILILQADERITVPNIEIQEDPWASPQTVVRITGNHDSVLTRIFYQNRDAIADAFIKSEYRRLGNLFYSFRDRKVMQKVKNTFGFSMDIPGGFYVATARDDFMWLRKETQKDSQGIIIYSYDYTDTLAFNLNRILSFRNNITREFIPGPAEGSYMTIDRQFGPVVSEIVNLNGLYARETRGLWKLEGDFMGGPFVNYTFVDEKGQKVVAIDGYVYAPNAPKRDMMLQVGAIIHSLKFD
ncbi:MAG: DUF4837 family protein [Bacteroidales bacterium]